MIRYRGAIGALAMVSALFGCAYSPPEASGLIALRPYPAPADVCQVVGESDATRAYLDHTALLIACPTHETGAIKDRERGGAERVGVAGRWTLLHIPQG